MLKLFFDLKYQNVTLTNPGVTVASDSKNYLVAKFNTISDDWEIPLSAIFVSTVDKVAYTVLVGQSANLEADECYVPWEVLKDSGEVYVSVFSGNLHTTNVAKFAVVKSGYVEGEIPPPPTPTVYEQILEELENKQDVIHLDNAIDEVYNPYGHYVLYYFDSQDIRHNIFDFEVFQDLSTEKIYQILDSTLQGDPNIAPSLFVKTKGNNYALVYEDSDDVLHELFDFSNLPNGTSDYTDLQNKPQINSHTLSGNKSSDDLGLQKKLTAGANITIANDGTISAGGGVDDYRRLQNLPSVRGNVESDIFSLTKGIHVDTSQFNVRLDSKGFVIITLWRVPKRVLEDYYYFYNGESLFYIPQDNYQDIYDFNYLKVNVDGIIRDYRKTGFWFMQGVNCRNVPQAFSDLVSDNSAMLVSHLSGNPLINSTNMYIFRRVDIIDSQNNIKTFLQYCYSYANSTGQVISVTDWQELNAGGSQLVSGVVNQNGTITFTDSDGNTFTTTGSSIIGFSPVATVTQTASGATVSITDKNGTTTANISNGADGQDYVLTPQDKSDIADIVLSELPTTQGVLYGNTSN